MAVDPVCGMEVKEGEFCSTHEGKKYCFCSQSCKDKCEKDPTGYVKSGEHKGHSCC